MACKQTIDPNFININKPILMLFHSSDFVLLKKLIECSKDGKTS